MRRITFGSCLLAVTAVMASPQRAFPQLIVHDQQYRCPAIDPHCANSVKKLPAFESLGNNATINYVEVKDDGQLWDGRELDDALAQIEKARDGGKQKPIVFVYIHGWQNNADEEKNKASETDCLKLNGDVAKFRTCGVERLASRFGGESRPVVGIYLAWRGLSTNVEPFKHFISYWPRRNKARYVGRKGMFKALDDIVRKVGEHRDDYTLLMIGHSFGARVLEYAAEAVDPGRNHCGFMERFRGTFDADKHRSDCPPAASDVSSAGTSKPPVDLFVYVNAATTHRMTFKALDDWKQICDTVPNHPVCKADPMYLATSSRTDYATAFLLPVADAVLPALRADRLHLISAANTPWLHTHNDPRKVTSCPDDISAESFCFDDPTPALRHPEKRPQKYYTEVHRHNAQSRFWIFNTGHRLIRNHGDVWNERVFNLVMEVLNHRIMTTAN